MDTTEDDISTLRRRSTLDVPSNTIERKSSRVNAVASVKAATSKLKSTSKSNVNGVSMQKRHSNAKKSQTLQGRTTSVPHSASIKKRTSLQSLKTLERGSTNSQKASFNLGALAKQVSKHQTTPAKKLSSGRELWFSRGSHVAVLAHNGAKFYLCRLEQNVFNFTKEAKVRWLSVAGVRFYPNIFKIAYLDKINPVSILMQVELSQKSRLSYLLPDHQREEIDKMIKLVEDIQSGNLSTQDVDDDVAEIVQIEEPPKKKTKLSKTVSQRARDRAIKAASKSSKPTQKAKKTEVKQKKEKAPKRKVPKKKEDELKLHPRPEIKVLDKDPLFETSLPMPYVSKVSNSKLVFRAINIGDAKMLRKLLKDGRKIKTLYAKSIDHRISPFHEWEKNPNKDILAVLLDECVGKKFKKRLESNQDDKQYLNRLGTGSYNRRSLGISYIRNIQASRGSKEGNNAFTKKEHEVSCRNELLDPSTMEEIVAYQKTEKIAIYEHMDYDVSDIIPCLLNGHNKAAGQIMKGRSESFGINFLMKDVLLSETEDLTSCPPSAVKYYSKRLASITPIHCAAVNPNDKYLKKLLSVEPIANVTDKIGRRPIHFAAASSSTATLELLLKWGANTVDTCTNLRIPLHYAILAKRVKNVEMLLKHAQTSTVIDPGLERYGRGGVNQPLKNSLTPLHMAAESEQVDVARVLLSYGASVNGKTSITNFRRTPLQMAAQTGNLEMVKLLVDHGAIVEEKDRLGRTALVYACKNGATKVLSYLLHIGANPERADSSNNSPLHYAAAYGWYFTVKFLLEAGVDPNVRNMWEITPVSVAYMKGHVGIVRELLNHDKININQAVADGTTLLFLACESDLTQEDLCSQIEYLVKEKGALCYLKDVNGKTALFYLAHAEMEDDDKKMEGFMQSVQIAQLLLDNGCDINAMDSDGNTALMEVLGNVSNTPLAEFLMKKGGKIMTLTGEERKCTVLEKINRNYYEARTGLPKMMQIMTKHYIKEMRDMAKCYNADGLTPLLDFCSRSITESQPEEISENEKSVLDYIKFLIKTLHSDVNAVVKKIVFPPDEVWPPEDSDKWYVNINYAKCTPLMIMLQRQDKSIETPMEAGKERIGIQIMNYLIENGADLNVVSLLGLTPLTICVQRKWVKVLSFFDKQKGCEVDYEVQLRGEKHEFHPLHMTSSFNQILALMDIGCDVNVMSKGKSPTTFLHKILKENQMQRHEIFSIIEELERSKQKYKFNGQDCKGRNPLHYATRANPGLLDTNLELEHKLIQLGSKAGLQDRKGKTPLHYVFQKGKPAYKYNCKTDPANLVQVICQTMTREEINAQDYIGQTALQLAAQLGATMSCILLLSLEHREADISLYDCNGNTALTMAVIKKKDACAVSLIQSGANLKDVVIDISGDELKKRTLTRKSLLGKERMDTDEEDDVHLEDEPTPWVLEAAKQLSKAEKVRRIPLLKDAVHKGLQGVVMLVSKTYRARSELTATDILKTAFETRHYNIAMDVLFTEQGKIKFQERDIEGRNLLHLLALSCGIVIFGSRPNVQLLIKVAKFLIDKKVPLEQPDNFGMYPIHYAVVHREFGLTDFFAEHSTSYDKNPNGKGFGYLEAAMWRIYSKSLDDKLWDYLEKLLMKGMNIDQFIKIPLYPDLVKIYPGLSKKDPEWSNRKTVCPTTALITAVTLQLNDYHKNVTKLLNFGANPNKADGHQVTPLMHAVMQNDSKCVKLLLDHNYVKDPKPATPVKSLNSTIFRLKPVMDEDSDSEDESDSDDENEQKKTEIDEEFEWVENANNVDVNAKDKIGRTALHCVASPTPEGTYDNAKIAFMLVKAGAKELKDKSGLTPYSLAVKTGALQTAKVLKSLGHGKYEKIHHHDIRDFYVNDGINFKVKNKPDFHKDADKVLKDSISMMDVDQKYIHEVDPNLSVQNGVLLKDGDLDVWFDVVLTKVDVKRSGVGLYNFYKIQLVHQPRPSLYILFTSWGCVGLDGQYQHTPFSDLTQAVKEFAKIFRQKTGNKWIDVKNFEAIRYKYRLLDDSARAEPPKMEAVKIDLNSDATSVLPDHLLPVVEKMMNPTSLIDAMRRIRHLHEESLPFGQLRKERLIEGKNILKEIRNYAKEVNRYRKLLDDDKDEEEKAKYYENCEKIAKLSNDYFHVIPQRLDMESCKPLDSLSTVENHIQSVDHLLDYEVACKMILGAMLHKKQTHPADYVYKCLDCKLELMQPEDPMSQLILRSITSNSSKVDILGIYKVSRSGEDERLINTKLGNRCLLWHGTPNSNLLSILSRGLMVSHTFHGTRYGKGMYFADSMHKSTTYSSNFVLACEVALGEPKYIKENDGFNLDEMSTDFNSVIAVSRYRDQEPVWFKLPSGVSINVEATCHTPREYILQNPAQVCMRYLIYKRDL